MPRKISKPATRVRSALAAMLLCSAAHAQQLTFDLPEQEATKSIPEFARQAGIRISAPSEELKGMRTPAIKGELTTDQALGKLLEGTGLTYQYLDRTTIAIQAKPVARATRDDVMRVAEAEASQGADTVEDSGRTLEEVVVSAQKRVERLQDVPVPVTAINADALVNGNQLRLQDYYTQIPGLNLTVDGSRGTPNLAIRGITAGTASNPTVGVVVDDVPYGGSTALGLGFSVADLDPSDLARIEVLRGPQGTLYGASSIGGLIHYVTIDPTTDGLSGQMQGGLSSVRNGDDIGFSTRGSVNVPLSDTFAVRASMFTRRDPGFIDNVQTGEEGVNWAEATGGRVSALWRPSADFSLKLSALLQDATLHGSSYVDALPGLTDLQQSRILRDSGGHDTNTQAYTAKVAARLGNVDLTALSGYSTYELSDTFDWTYGFGQSAQQFFGVPAVGYLESGKTKKFTQEIRFSIPIGERIEWLLGAFYARETSQVDQQLQAIEPTAGVSSGLLFDGGWHVRYTEYAAFSNLTFELTDRFDIQIGARESQDRQSRLPAFRRASSFTGSATVTDGVRFPKENAFTYLLTPRLKISPDLMIYARLASGYRPGGNNGTRLLNGEPILNPTYGPDKTQNYEIGVKGSIFGRVLSFDASVFHIDWKEIQTQVIVPGQGSFYMNGAEAESEGVELSVESRPLTGLAIAAWVSWNAAELSEDFPPNNLNYGISGDRLPFSSRFSGSLSLQQDFPLANRLTGFVGGSVSYIGDRVGNFQASALRQPYPAYAKADIRAGIAYESWTVNAFINNVGDKRGLLSGGLEAFPTTAFSYIQPRTVGVSVAKMF